MTTFVERLSALDRFFLDCETEATPMHIGAACIFEAGDAPSVGELRAHIGSRLEMIPRYRQRLVQVPLEQHPVWVDAADFDIARHVREVHLAPPGDSAQLQEMLSWIFSQPLSRSRPLWEAWLIRGLSGGDTVLACKSHHCLADGIGGAALLAAVLSDSPFDRPADAEQWKPRPAPSGVELLAEAAACRLRGASDLAGRLFRHTLDSPASVLAEAGRVGAAAGRLLGKLWSPLAPTAFDAPTASGSELLQWSSTLQGLRDIGRAAGATVNDVVLTLVAEAFARCPDLRRTNSTLRVYCPVGASASAGVVALGNRVAGMLVDLPIEQMDPVERLRTVADVTRRQKTMGEVEGTLLVEELANVLAPSMLATAEWLAGQRTAFHLLVTNVPGPPAALYLFRQRMRYAIPLVPLFRGQGLGIAVLSYCGRVTWGFHVDASRAGAAMRVRDAVEEAFTELTAATRTPAALRAVHHRPGLAA